MSLQVRTRWSPGNFGCRNDTQRSAGRKPDREPRYDHDGSPARNVFDPEGPRVRWPDGGWHHEALITYGRLVASTEPILRFLDVCRVFGNDISERRHRRRGTWCHAGSLPDTNTMACHRGDEINFAVLFNRRRQNREERRYSWEIAEMINDMLDNTPIIWPHSGRMVGSGGGAAHP